MLIRVTHRVQLTGVTTKAVNSVAVILIASLALTGAIRGEAVRITLDGGFSDWDGVLPVHSDPAGDNQGGLTDFGRLWMANDEDFLFLSLEVGAEINLQSDNDLKLYLDTDDDPATGFPIQGIGAELEWTFGTRSGRFSVGTGSYEVAHVQLGITSLPTVTSERFEIAIARDSRPAGTTRLFPDDTLAIVVVDGGGGDVLPDPPAILRYVLDDTPLEPLGRYSLARYKPHHVRILTYNVLSDGLSEPGRKPSFARILKAIGPDIIGFQEIYDQTSRQTAALIESMLPSVGGQSWYHSRVSPDIIALSRFPIRETFAIGGNGAFLLDLRPFYDLDMLLIVAHPPCCDNDAGRQREIDAMMAFIRDAKAPGGVLDLLSETPIAIIGDMNLVGDRQQLETLLTGEIMNVGSYGQPFQPDWDGSDLEDLMPRHTDLPLAYTWYDEWSSFWPGRLDYIIYSGSVMDIGNSFVLFTPGMTSDTLTTYGLYTDDTVLASDHCPVVADLILPASLAEFEIHCLDLGQGDCTLLVSPEGGTLLIGAGLDGQGTQRVIPYLEDRGMTALDYIVAPNYLAESIGGIDEVLEHFGPDSVKVGVLDRGWSFSSEVFDDYVAAAGDKRVQIVGGQTIDLGGGVTVTCIAVNGNDVLSPPFDAQYEEGDLSVAILARYGDFEFFVAGDLSGVTDGRYHDIETSVAAEVGDVDVYRVSSHGSARSSNTALLSGLMPEVAIISVGNANPGGYPDQTVIDRLVSGGTYIYQTEVGTGGTIPPGSGQVVSGDVTISMISGVYVVNREDSYDIEPPAQAIGDLRAVDVNGEPLLLGRSVTLRGVVTVGTGTFSTADNDVFIQDATGGVNVFERSSQDPLLAIGDRVDVTGNVDQYRGLTRITSPSLVVRSALPAAVETTLVTAGDIASSGETHEGLLIRIENCTISGGQWPGIDEEATLSVGDSTGEFTLFIDSDTDIDGSDEPTDTLVITGIVSQHDASFPYLSDYRVVPRSREDIRPVEREVPVDHCGLIACIRPNPASSVTEILFSPAAAAVAKRIAFYDISGRLITKTTLPAGRAGFTWDARDDRGRKVASGIYLLHVKTPLGSKTVKIVVVH
jgi:beta-lactamase superfamily II metal-dependent hydrolase